MQHWHHSAQLQTSPVPMVFLVLTFRSTFASFMPVVPNQRPGYRWSCSHSYLDQGLTKGCDFYIFFFGFNCWLKISIVTQPEQKKHPTVRCYTQMYENLSSRYDKGSEKCERLVVSILNSQLKKHLQSWAVPIPENPCIVSDWSSGPSSQHRPNLLQ